MDRPQTFILRSPEILGNCIAMIAQAPTDGTVAVQIKAATEKRRLAQNATYFMWVNDIKDQTGYSVDEVHDKLRKRFLPGIYLEKPLTPRQEKWVLDYADTIDRIKNVEDDGLVDYIIDLIKLQASTTWATVQQFSAYLGMIDHMAINKSWRLRHPDEYHIAMGSQGIQEER